MLVMLKMGKRYDQWHFCKVRMLNTPYHLYGVAHMAAPTREQTDNLTAETFDVTFLVYGKGK